MRTFYLLIGLVQFIPVALSFNQSVHCSLRDFKINGSQDGDKKGINGGIDITYDKNNLAVYKYNNTQLVNLLFLDVQVDFKEEGALVNSANKFISISSDVEGIALLEKNESSASPTFKLTQCELDFKKYVKHSKKVSNETQQIIAELANSCVRDNFCSKLGLLTQDNFILAKIEHHNFKEKSVSYKLFNDKYSNLAAPYVGTETKIGFEKTVNFLLDFLIASVLTKESGKEAGKIDFPNVDKKISGILNGHAKLINGTFGDVNTIKRKQDVILTVEGLESSLDIAYRLPNPHIHFDQYEVKYFLLTSSGYADIYIKDIDFRIQVVVNFNEIPCKIEAPKVEIQIGEITIKMNDKPVVNFILDIVLNEITSILHSSINSFLRNKISQLIDKAVVGFDCEQWRP